MTYVAAIDCGTNSIRLLIAQEKGAQNRTDNQVLAFPAQGPIQVYEREMRIVRLGQDVDQSGKFHPQALARTFAAVEEYAQIIARYPVEKIRFIATSASRDVDNREEFVSGIKARLGVAPEVIAGKVEAGLSFLGATSALNKEDDPVLVVDIGGGSTEFVVGKAGKVQASYSTDMGSVRIQERYLRSCIAQSPQGKGSFDPGRTKGILSALYRASEAIDYLVGVAHQSVDFSKVKTLVGVAGTVTTITALALGLDHYAPQRIHGVKLPLDQVKQACNWLMEADVDQRAALGFMPAGRQDVIGAGALIWRRIIEGVCTRLPAERRLETVLTSEQDILDGIAIDTLGLNRA